MTKRETTSLLVKLMGVFCLVQFFPSLTHILGYLVAIRGSSHLGMNLMNVGVMFITPAFWLGFSFLIILKSDSIARRLHREDSEASHVSSLGFADVQTLGYNFIGVFLLVQSLPNIVRLLTTIKVQQLHMPPIQLKEEFYLNTLPYLLSFLTQFLLGLLLFLKPRGLANLWKKAQVMKYDKAEPDNSTLDGTT